MLANRCIPFIGASWTPILQYTFVLMLSAIGLLHASPAQSDPATEFNTAYRAYNAAHDEGRFEEAIPHAKRALELGETLLADRPDQLAMMTYNLAYTYQLAGHIDDAIETYEAALKRYEAVFGERSIELAELLDFLASSYVAKSDKSPWDEKYSPMAEARKTMKRLLKLSEYNYGPSDARVASVLTRLGDIEANIRKWSDAAGRFERAISIVDSADASSILIHGDALIGLGRVSVMRKREKRAISYLEQALALLEAAENAPSKMVVGAHILLVVAHEELGNRDRATPHAKAIALLGADEGASGPYPIFRVTPRFPRIAQERGIAGVVILGFDVDAAGMVVNAKVIAAKPKGIFNDEALKAVNRFRYAPDYVDGQIVGRRGNTIRLVWELEGLPIPELEWEPSDSVTTSAATRPVLPR